jgi:hypothetical protein
MASPLRLARSRDPAQLRMKKVDFYQLQRAIQDRFVGSVISGFPPAPLAVARGATPRKVLWLVLSAASFVALVVFAKVGYGDLDSGASLHSGKVLVIWAALVFGVVFGLVMAYAQLVRERALPYPPGIYVFPACVIDARSDVFTVHPMAELASVVAAGSSVRLSFTGTGGQTFVLPVDAAQSARVVSEVQAGRERAMRAEASGDPGELIAVDPLHQPRFSSPVGAREPHARQLPPWGNLGWAIAAAAGVVIGPGLWALRNAGSDARLYARATQADDRRAYAAYLERGHARTAEVRDTLLPLAELRDVERAGDVDALLAFQAAHAGSQIEAQVSAAVHNAMLAELQKAKAPGTLVALEDFRKKYPKHGAPRELREAVDAVFARGLASYKGRAKADDKAQAFAAKLFDHAKRSGPRIEVRFRRKASESMDRADQYVLKTPSFAGVASYPSRYFDDKHASRREELLGKLLTARLDGGLSSELFDVTTGALVPDGGPLPEVTVPTLFVTHRQEWSGHAYASTMPRGSYVGVTFFFDATFVIPGQVDKLNVKAEVLKGAALGVLKDDEPALPPGQAEDKVYEAMAKDAYDQFGTRVLGLLFKDLGKDGAPDGGPAATPTSAQP